MEESLSGRLERWLYDYEYGGATFDELPKGEALSQRLSDGTTLLHSFVIWGSSSALNALLERGADPKTATPFGETPLHFAAASGEYECCYQLLCAGGRDLLNAKTDDGETALHYAAKYKWTHIYKLLNECGADGSIKNKNGKLPIDIFREISISELYSIRSIKKQQYMCPFCHSSLQTWTIDKSGKEVARPLGALVTDGDIVPGVSMELAHTIGWTEDAPCYWGLELARPCGSCQKEGFFIFANCLSKKYSFQECEGRLLFNSEMGTPEYFKVNLKPLSMHKMDRMCIGVRPEHQPTGHVRYWRDIEFNGGCWHVTEYKSDTLPPMQAHRIGPFRIQDIADIKDPYGVSACTGSGTEWEFARELIVDLFPCFLDISEQREGQWRDEHAAN